MLQIKTSYKNKAFIRQKRPSSNIQLCCSCVSYLVFLLLPHIQWFSICRRPNLEKPVMPVKLHNHWERLSPGLLVLEFLLLLIFLLTSFLKRSSSLMWPQSDKSPIHPYILTLALRYLFFHCCFLCIEHQASQLMCFLESILPLSCPYVFLPYVCVWTTVHSK